MFHILNVYIQYIEYPLENHGRFLQNHHLVMAYILAAMKIFKRYLFFGHSGFIFPRYKDRQVNLES